MQLFSEEKPASTETTSMQKNQIILRYAIKRQSGRIQDIGNKPINSEKCFEDHYRALDIVNRVLDDYSMRNWMKQLPSNLQNSVVLRVLEEM